MDFRLVVQSFCIKSMAYRYSIGIGRCHSQPNSQDWGFFKQLCAALVGVILVLTFLVKDK